MCLSALKPYLSLEPAFFLFYMVRELAYLADVNLYLQKSCRNYTLSEPNLSTSCDDERKGIEFVASANSRYQLWGGVFSITTTILVSSWSDKAPNRSKSSMLAMLSIQLAQMIGMCVQARFWHWPALAAVFTEMLYWPEVCMRVSSIIYICSLTSTKDRTFRLTLLHVLITLAVLLSNGSSGFLLRHLGFFYTYTLCAALSTISLLYVAVFMKNMTSDDATSRGCVKSCLEFVDVRSVLQAFRLVFGKWSGNERIVIISMYVVNLLSSLCFFGELSVLYLYLRYRFGWNEEDYGIFGFYKTAAICFGSTICLGISKFVRIEDSALALFAAFWDVLASLGYYYAEENWQIYLVPLLDIFRGFSVRVSDSIQTKFFKNDEYGQLFSVNKCGEFFLCFGLPLYNLLFEKTMDFAPASVFLLSASINICVVVLYGISYLLIRRMPKTDSAIPGQ